jgi:hypothetical protein
VDGAPVQSQKGKRGEKLRNFLSINPRQLIPLPPSPDLSSTANPDCRLRLAIRALAAMDGGGGAGGAEGELTAQETALYDRQIRVWGVDAQKRCAAAKDLVFALSCLFPRPCFFCSFY